MPGLAFEDDEEPGGHVTQHDEQLAQVFLRSNYFSSTVSFFRNTNATVTVSLLFSHFILLVFKCSVIHK